MKYFKIIYEDGSVWGIEKSENEILPSCRADCLNSGIEKRPEQLEAKAVEIDENEFRSLGKELTEANKRFINLIN